MKKAPNLSILTIGHFLVDLSCLYFYFICFPQNGLVGALDAALLYNFLAFALQAPIGYFFDKFPAKLSTGTGILLILGGYCLGLCHLPPAGLLLCGLGNAFYHVGGSIGIAGTNQKGLQNSGIFVSAGALGVSLGTWLANRRYLLSISFANSTTIVILLLLVVLLLLQTALPHTSKPQATELSTGTNASLLLLSLLAVFIRSLGGLFFPPAYKEVFSFTQVLFPENLLLYSFFLAIASGITAFLGKFLGGFFSCLCASLLQKFFPKKQFDLRSCNYIFGAATLLLSVICFALGSNLHVLCNSGSKATFCFLGVLFFHAAMPVTLFELYCILPDHPGFAMGLSTVMLFLGYLPYAFFPMDGLPATLILYLLTLLAAICMIISLVTYQRATRITKQ